MGNFGSSSLFGSTEAALVIHLLIGGKSELIPKQAKSAFWQRKSHFVAPQNSRRWDYHEKIEGTIISRYFHVFFGTLSH